MALCLSLCTVTALAVDSYTPWVGGVQVTSENADDVLGDGTVSYDSDTKTLTLNNANISGTYEYQPWYEAMIYSAMGDLTINLIGNNTLKSTNTYADGIDAAGGCNVTVTGRGTLTIDTAYYGFYIGSYDVAGGDLIFDSTTVTVKDTQAAGIWVNHDITMTDSTVSVTKTNDSYNGIVSNIDGTITVTNSNVSVNTKMSAIHMGNTDASNHRLVFNSGTLTISSSDGYGIYVEPSGSTGNINGALTINGGTLSIQSASGATNIPLTAVTVASGSDVITGNDLHSTGSVVVAPITSYDLYFNMGNHGTQIDPQTVEEGNKATKPSDPTAAGYTFGGWYKEAGCTNAWNFATDTVTANTTLYAKWTKNSSGRSSGTVTTVVNMPLIRTGNRGDSVKELQAKLNALGYNCGAVDGIFGSKTYAAVVAFQKAMGIGVDGVVGPETWGKLDVTGITVTTAPSAVTSAVNLTISSNMPLITKGSTGDAVKALQTKLNALGYDCGKVDGIFGDKTLAAVKAYQTDKALLVDGKVGNQTWGALR